MSPEEQAEFGTVLAERERAVRAQLDVNARSAEPPQLDEEIGRLTRMDALQQQQMALHGRRRLQTQLAQIHGALQRVGDGSFGLCALCQEPLPRARLDLTPEAPFCVPCQGRLEREGKR